MVESFSRSANMPTPQQLPSSLEHARALADADILQARLTDDAELGFESACPWLQFEAWEPVDASRAPSLGAGY
jgi:hypothetical protein